MKSNKEEQQSLFNAKKQVQKIKIFYLHFALYIIVVGLITLNFFVMSGPYVSIITGLNISVLVFWTVFVCIHAWSVFKGRSFFKKSWEDKKAKQFLEEENVETTMWE